MGVRRQVPRGAQKTPSLSTPRSVLVGTCDVEARATFSRFTWSHRSWYLAVSKLVAMQRLAGLGIFAGHDRL